MVYFGEYHVHLKKVYILCWSWPITVWFIYFVYSVIKSSITFLIFCVSSLFIIESEILESPTIYLIVFFISSQFCQFLHTIFCCYAIWCIYVYNGYIFRMDKIISSSQMLLFISSNILLLKSILSGINVGILVFFGLLFLLYIVSFYFQLIFFL